MKYLFKISLFIISSFIYLQGQETIYYSDLELNRDLTINETQNFQHYLSAFEFEEYEIISIFDPKIIDHTSNFELVDFKINTLLKVRTKFVDYISEDFQFYADNTILDTDSTSTYPFQAIFLTEINNSLYGKIINDSVTYQIRALSDEAQLIFKEINENNPSSCGVESGNGTEIIPNNTLSPSNCQIDILAFYTQKP